MSGGKRHSLVDTIGLIIKVRIHPADEPGNAGARPLPAALLERMPRLELILADGGLKKAFAAWVVETLDRRVEVVEHPDAGLRHLDGTRPGATGATVGLSRAAPSLVGRTDLRLAGVASAAA